MVQINSINGTYNQNKMGLKNMPQTSFKSNNEIAKDTVELQNAPQKTKSKKGVVIALASAAAVIGAVLLLRKKPAVDDLKKAASEVIEDAQTLAGKATDSAEAVEKEVVNDVPAYHLKTAKECITKLFGEIPTEKAALEKFVNTQYEAIGCKMPTLPLNVAAHYGDNDLIKLFLEHGADVNHAGVSEETALHAATKKGHIETVKLLLDKDADMNAIYNKTYKAEDFISHGRDAHAIELAAENGHNDLIELFISKGVEINRTDSFGNTPLSLASENGHLGTVELLLSKGLDVNAKDGLKQTALHKAAHNGHKDVVELLLSKNADVSLLDDCERPAIIHAAQGGRKNVFETFLAHGCDVNMPNGLGSTSLHEVSGMHANKDMIEFLIGKGANINALDNAKRTPLDVAIAWKENDIIDLLKSKNAKLGSEVENISG